MKYTITKKFTSGTLKGLTIQERTSVLYEVGFVCKKPVGGTSAYVILTVVPCK